MSAKSEKRDLISDIFIIVLSIVFLLLGLALTIFSQHWSTLTEIPSGVISVTGVCCSILALLLMIFTKD